MRSVNVHRSYVGQLKFGEMSSYLQWECYMEVSQRQHSLHQCVPKKQVSLIFGDYWPVKEWCHEFNALCWLLWL